MNRPPPARAAFGVLRLPWLVLGLLLAATPAALGQPAPAKDGQDPLAAERWVDEFRGVSFRPPLGARISERVADDARVRILGEPGYSITLFLRSASEPLSILTLRREVVERALMARMQTNELTKKGDLDMKVAGLPACSVYFRIDDPKRGPWINAQVYVALDPFNIALLQLDVPEKNLEAVEPLFAAVLASMEVEDPQKAGERRKALVEAGEEFLKTIDMEKVSRKLVPDQYYRIVDGEKDVGYMRVQQRTDRQLEMAGITVQVDATLSLGGRVYDSASSFFLSHSRNDEVWTVRVEVRDLEAQAAGRPAAAVPWSETGVRSGGTITIARNTLAEAQDFKWDQPPKGYLSQVEIFLLDRLLDRRQPVELGFYAYNTTTGKVSFRTEKVVPDGGDGGCEIRSRATPTQAEQVTQYAADGSLIRRVLPNGQLMIPSTRAEVRQRWPER